MMVWLLSKKDKFLNMKGKFSLNIVVCIPESDSSQFDKFTSLDFVRFLNQ